MALLAKPKKQVAAMSGPALIDGNMVMPEDFDRFARIRDLLSNAADEWGCLSSGAQRFVADHFTDDAVNAMAGRSCADEALELVRSVRPDLIYMKEAPDFDPLAASMDDERLVALWDEVQLFYGIDGAQYRDDQIRRYVKEYLSDRGRLDRESQAGKIEGGAEGPTP